ncbi:methylenetetrahydrofolate reductase [NAD(P)H] [Cellulosilyticum sp. I15G10I2]|uniref:methylenetetrahydrofolate reductase [NAD(P)H] n=1 Tax=Cellulosilyticum sp. I15G10I2 TaxID=1892843 RepID=UPI002E8DE018|nr:methylenetetrahydrofolate reductase [NAD(P)H] [Cellulosilyticum sp. I15G10I2]
MKNIIKVVMKMFVKEIIEIKKPTFSFEIFPPKSGGNLESIYGTVDALASLMPDFISVTYGAGGSSRENTVEIASVIQNKYNIPTLAHLTCVGSTKDQMDNILKELDEKGVKNILALRGDLNELSTLGDFKYASDLISYIKNKYHFNIVSACYPEKHLEAYSIVEDLKHLRSKVDSGTDMLVSQLFFDNQAFYNFAEKARSIGINVPIVAGIMPITSSKQIERMVSLCGATVPESVQRFIRAYGHNSMAIKEAGIAYATRQIIDLLASGVDGIHLYTMNQADIAKRIAENIRGILYALRVKRE